MQPQLPSAMYHGMPGNVPYNPQPGSGPYSMSQPQQAVYGNTGAFQQQQPGVMMGGTGPMQHNLDYGTVSQYGFASDSIPLQGNQQISPPVGHAMLGQPPSVIESMGTSSIAIGSAMGGGAGAVNPPGGISQAIGQGMGISEGFPCVRLRGLPFDANEQDVEGWLGTEPLDIILVRRGGTLTGEAYVLLRLPIQVEHVLSKNKSYLGQRYIEVALAKKLDFYREVYVMVRDDEESKTAMRSSHSRPSRDHVSRSSRQDSPSRKRSSRRSSSRDRSKRHHRDEPRERDRIDADSAERGERADRHQRAAAADQPHTGILKMRGLPFAATADDIVQWFSHSASALTSDRVHIVMSSGGRPMGTAFVQFASTDDSQAAMAMDRKTMGSRYIELFVAMIGEASSSGAPFT